MDFESLVSSLSAVQNALQTTAAHAVNLSLTCRNWLMGHYIVEFEQNGTDRAQYGEQLLKKLEERINTKGISERRLREFRQFYLAYPQLGTEVVKVIADCPEIRRTISAVCEAPIRRMPSAEFASAAQNLGNQIFVPAERLLSRLSYSQLLALSAISDPIKRVFYEIESIRGCWSYEELKRQINSLFYERCGLSRNKEALVELANKSAESLTPRDVINTPVTLEFLGLNNRALVTENDLEQAILDHLENFLLEMGTGFCFEGRQKRLLIDDDYYFVDMVFYHRILKCHIICELKIDAFKHEYASQLNMYLNYYKNEVMQHDDNPPIGLLLCTDKGETLVKYATAGLDQNIFVEKYMIQLPSEEEIKKFITKEIQE